VTAADANEVQPGPNTTGSANGIAPGRSADRPAGMPEC
jgi:hypothetical protein